MNSEIGALLHAGLKGFDLLLQGLHARLEGWALALIIGGLAPEGRRFLLQAPALAARRRRPQPALRHALLFLSGLLPQGLDALGRALDVCGERVFLTKER